VLGGLLVVGVAGCTAADPPRAAAPLDRATGAVLADAAERLASALEDGDACQAHAEVDALEARADAAHRAGEAPEEVVAETVRVARAVTAGVVCGEGAPVTLDAEDPAEETDAEVAPDVEVEAAPAGPAPAAPAPAAPAPAPTSEATASAEPNAGTATRGNGNGDGNNGNGGGNGGGGGNRGGNGGGNGRGNGGRG
jgi:hypothetical protein